VTRHSGGISGIGARKPRIVRSWDAAREKCDLEQGCRICGAWPVEAAHIIGRDKDGDFPVRNEDWSPWDVAPDRIVPLCHDHHQGPNGQHAKRLELLSYLTLPEQIQAVADAGGISRAMVLLSPSTNPKRVAA
jgi:hypothetical protein